MKSTMFEHFTFVRERKNHAMCIFFARHLTSSFRFVAFMSSFGGLFVHEYSGRFISPIPVFTSVTDTQSDPPAQAQDTQYLSTFSIDGFWYLLWSGTGAPYPGTLCRVLMPSQIAGKFEESAVAFASVTGITSSASQRAE